jgi:CRP-like cAMP-binding protein
LTDPLETFPLLARLRGEEREALSEALEALDVDAGTLLFDEGDPAVGLVLVAEGRVRVASRRTGEQAELGPGASLGAFSLAAHGVREARAETTSRCRLLVLGRDAYERLVADAPRTACRLMEGVLADTARLLRGDLEASVDPVVNND